MNSDQERPFMCNAPGCSQRFPTEDHLMIHRHKHEMTLKFPSIKNDNMLSDHLTAWPGRPRSAPAFPLTDGQPRYQHSDPAGLALSSVQLRHHSGSIHQQTDRACPRLSVLIAAPTKQTETASASLHAWNSARPDHAWLLRCADAYGETNVHGFQYDGYARTHPQQLLLFHSHSLHALRSQTEAEGCTFTPPGCHRQRQHELHGPHDGDDVIAAGARRPPSHALAPAPAPASPSPRVPAPRSSPPQPGPRPGWTPPPAGTQSPSQLSQSPPPSRAPTPDLTAPSNALFFTYVTCDTADAAHADTAVSAPQRRAAQASSGRGPGRTSAEVSGAKPSCSNKMQAEEKSVGDVIREESRRAHSDQHAASE
uniref:cAMP responsive element binding protein 5b n=1 Tax=Dicentrarchus labrax TaxID=13489 RepID=A0A8P4KJB2_DICLA